MTPLVVVVGFLGAGKTTFLRTLVPKLIQAGQVPTLILNDYQNARVDAELFRDLSLLVTPISGSCVCCGSREELRSALLAYSHPARGILLLEANGTTDAEELIAALASDPKLRSFSLPLQISIVDAKRWQKRFWHNGLERRQVHTATHLYLGHADEVSATRLQEVRDALAALLPQIQPADPEALAAVLVHLQEELTPQTRQDILLNEQPDKHRSAHHHEHHFSAQEIALPKVVSPETLRSFLRHLPPDVLRAKGLARVQEEPEQWVIFQKVSASDTPQIAPLPSPPQDPRPTLILVGPHHSLPASAFPLAVG